MYQGKLIFDAEVKTQRGIKIPFGIHTNCKVTSLVKGENYVDINFEDQEGRTHNKRLWEPNGKFPKQGETSAEALQRESVENLAHIVKVLHIFLGEESLAAIKAETYEGFIDKAIKAVTPRLNSETVNLKLIYDAEGIYSTFGKFPDYIEKYIPEEKSKLSYSKWEKENRSEYKGEQDKSVPKQSEALNSLFQS